MDLTRVCTCMFCHKAKKKNIYISILVIGYVLQSALYPVYLMVKFMFLPNRLTRSALKGQLCPVRKHTEVNDLTSFYLDLVHLRNSSLKCIWVFRHLNLRPVRVPSLNHGLFRIKWLHDKGPSYWMFLKYPDDTIWTIWFLCLMWFLA